MNATIPPKVKRRARTMRRGATQDRSFSNSYSMSFKLARNVIFGKEALDGDVPFQFYLEVGIDGIAVIR